MAIIVYSWMSSITSQYEVGFQECVTFISGIKETTRHVSQKGYRIALSRVTTIYFTQKSITIRLTQENKLIQEEQIKRILAFLIATMNQRRSMFLLSLIFDT